MKQLIIVILWLLPAFLTATVIAFQLPRIAACHSAQQAQVDAMFATGR